MPLAQHNNLVQPFYNLYRVQEKWGGDAPPLKKAGGGHLPPLPPPSYAYASLTSSSPLFLSFPPLPSSSHFLLSPLPLTSPIFLSLPPPPHLSPGACFVAVTSTHRPESTVFLSCHPYEG